MAARDGRPKRRRSYKIARIPRVKLPKSLLLRPGTLDRLKEAAVWAKERYSGNVYLVGEALFAENPRVWDVRLKMRNAEFCRFYGGEELDPEKAVKRWIWQGRTGYWRYEKWCWQRECRRVSGFWAWKTGLNVDFRTLPRYQFSKQGSGQKRMQLA